MNRWWADDSNEIFWLEITDRPDIGVDLKAPQRKSDGGEFWGYSLIREINDGDVIFHYSKPAGAVVGRSRASEPLTERPIVWGAHGTAARRAGTIPYERSGWHLPVSEYAPLDRAITLDDLRVQEEAFRAVRDSLRESYGPTLYFPFELSPNRPPRPVQGYLAKWPAGLVPLLDPLHDAAVELTPPLTHGFGTTYREVPEQASESASETEIWAIDPSARERGSQVHRATQNALARFLQERGLQPRSPAFYEPPFDLGWEHQGFRFVAEVKSTTPGNAERQLRLGLGQILRYRHLMQDSHRVRAVLVTSSPPPAGWEALCESLGVALVWPETFSVLG